MRAQQLRSTRPASPWLSDVDIPTPTPGPGEVLIQIEACAVCRTDLQIAMGDLSPRGLPRIPGHQIVGRITAVGDGVDAERIGSRVGVAWLADSCGHCRFCQEGRENLCRSAAFTGWDRDGGYADRAIARADFAHAIDGDPVDVAPLLCGGVIGYRSLRIAGVGPNSAGMRLGLFGFGASATLVLQLARYWGCETYVVTRSRAEVKRAVDLGADWAGTYDEPLPVLLDAAITFAPAGDVVRRALQSLERGGTVAINAIHLDGGIPPLDYGDLWWERSLRSVANVTRSDIVEFLSLVRLAGIRTQVETLPLDQANMALQRVANGDVQGAFVLVP